MILPVLLHYLIISMNHIRACLRQSLDVVFRDSGTLKDMVTVAEGHILLVAVTVAQGGRLLISLKISLRKTIADWVLCLATNPSFFNNNNNNMSSQVEKHISIFDSTHFRAWEAQMTAFLQSQGLWHIANGTWTCPTLAVAPAPLTKGSWTHGT